MYSQGLFAERYHNTGRQGNGLAQDNQQPCLERSNGETHKHGLTTPISQKHKRGRKPLFTQDEFTNRLETVELRDYTTQRATAKTLGVSQGSIQRMMRAKRSKPHSPTSLEAAKPSLDDDDENSDTSARRPES